MSETTAPPAETRRPTRDLRSTGRVAAAVVAAGLAWWVVGFAAHLLAGLRLPISQAWPTVLPGAGPRTALPVGQYAAPGLVFSACVAAGLAVLAGRVVLANRPRAGAWLGAGVGVVGLVVSLAQSLRVVSPLQAPGLEARLVVDAAVAAAVVGTVVGLLAGLAASRAGAWRTLGAGVLAVAAEPWLREVVVGIADPGQTPIIGDRTSTALGVVPWVAAVLLALALSASRPWRAPGLAAWVTVLVVACVVPALEAAASYVVGYARNVDVASAGGFAELADSGRDVLALALAPGDRRVGPLVLAVVLGLVLRIARDRIRDRGQEDDDPAGSAAAVAGSTGTVG